MKVDWDELKREHAALAHARSDSAFPILEFGSKLAAQFPAILAEREAAQRLRDEVAKLDVATEWEPVRKALAAFDKETQNEG